MRRLAFAVFLALALPTYAADFASVVRLVQEPDAAKVEPVIAKALTAPEKDVRLAAARIAMVRGLTSQLNALRLALDYELDSTVAREQIRAILLLGGLREVDRALVASDRFGKRMHDDIASMVSRLGPPAIETYLSTFKGQGSASSAYFRQALWQHPELASPTAAKLLDARDELGLWMLYMAIEDEPRNLIAPDVLVRALNHVNEEIATDAAWFTASYAAMSRKVDPTVLEAASLLRTRFPKWDTVAVAGIIRRAAGQQPGNAGEFLDSLKQRRVILRFYLGSPKMLDLLTPRERELVEPNLPERFDRGEPMAFALPSAQPTGMTEKVLATYGCSGGWFGDARVSADSVGRITSSDLTAVKANDNCRAALDALIRLSLIRPSRITSIATNVPVPLVHAPSSAACLDETAAQLAPRHAAGRYALIAPRVKTKMSARYPANARETGEVLVETVVSENGCVRTARILRGLKDMALNQAALVAAAQWTFDPGKIDTQPVELTLPIVIDMRP